MKLNDDLNWAGTFTGFVNGLTSSGPTTISSVVDQPITLNIADVAKARYQITDNNGAVYIAVAVVTDQGHMLYVSAVGSNSTAFFKAKERDDHKVKEFTSVHQQAGSTTGNAIVYLGKYRRAS
ncbi:MAG: hypothetical protein ACYCOU_03515 [Sulfobacillus sp.]